MNQTENILLQRFAATGDAAAFSEIVHRYAGLVYGVCLRILADKDDAADATQDTFFQLLKQAKEITGSIPNWLHKVAKSKAIDRIRKDSRRRQREAKYAADTRPDRQEWQNISQHIDQALDQLDDDLKDILIRYFFQGRSMADIADTKGLSHQTISRRIESAVAQLRTKLRKRGIIAAPAVLASLLAQNALEAAPAVLLKELGKMAIAGAGAKATAVGTAAAGIKAKIITVAAVTAIGVGGVVTYNQVTQPPSKSGMHVTEPAPPDQDPAKEAPYESQTHQQIPQDFPDSGGYGGYGGKAVRRAEPPEAPNSKDESDRQGSGPRSNETSEPDSPEDDDVELLKTVALQHKANFDSLRTWKGEAFEESISTRGDPKIDYMLRNKCIFAYDKSRDAARWNKQPQEHRHVVEGKEVHWRNFPLFYNSAMIMRKYHYRYRLGGERDGKDVFHLNIEPLRPDIPQDIPEHNFTLDPRYFLGDPLSGWPVYDMLMYVYDNVDNIVKPSSNVTYVKRAGNLVTFETWMPEHKNTVKYVFDLSVGGNLVDYFSESPNHETVHEFQYEQQSGVWVPKSYKYKNITEKQKGAGALRSSRTIRWSNSVVNVLFEEDEFTVEKLGVKPGDPVNHRKGRDYYRDFLSNPEMLKELYPQGLVSLLGKALPELREFKLKVDPKESQDRKIVVCFWDMQQRPSRHCVHRLNEKAGLLSGKGVCVVLVETGSVDEAALKKFVQQRKITLPVGRISGKPDDVLRNWGVQSLPWLILTDREHVVTAEGFSVQELSKKIEESGDFSAR